MITVCETKDATLLAQLNRHVHTLHHQWQPAVFKPWDETAVKEFYEQQLQNEHCLAYLACHREEVVGYMLLFVLQHPETAFTNPRQTLRLDQILVLPEHRRLGVGQALIYKARAVAEERNIQVLELSHWQENEAASAFFGKLGFKPYFHKLWLHTQQA